MTDFMTNSEKSLVSIIVEDIVRSGRHSAPISHVRLSGQTENFMSGAPNSKKIMTETIKNKNV